MKQTTISVVLEVQPASATRLSGLIDQLRFDEENPGPGYTDTYVRLRAGVPVLHFMSMSVFSCDDYDPVFVIEANFDGSRAAFWAQLEATIGPSLRDMLRCCKKPLDSDGPVYLSVTAPGSRSPLAPYFASRTITPSVYHHGNRGLDRDRIIKEGELFIAARRELAQDGVRAPKPYRTMNPAQIHATLRAALLPSFHWLDTPAPPRIPVSERIGDLLRLAGFLVLVLFCLSIPGIVIGHISTTPRFLILFAVLAAVIYFALYRMREPPPGKAVPTRTGGLTLSSLSTKNEPTSLAHPVTLLIVVLLALALYVVLVTTVGAVLVTPMSGPFTSERFSIIWEQVFRDILHGLAVAIVFTLPAIVLWLRFLERRDSSHDAPPVNTELLTGMAHREDRIAQNHMGSIVIVKPGVLRTALFRAGHRGLGLVLRVVATNGYLGSMRTVHFAHWAFVSNGSRLLFTSNFDHSWESYLDDFIEKAHGGLTLAWGSCIGFPPARFLVLDGASHGRQFKAWARHSMTVSRFWFSAYRNFTVDQIERQYRIASGLRKPALTPQEATEWIRDL